MYIDFQLRKFGLRIESHFKPISNVVHILLKISFDMSDEIQFFLLFSYNACDTRCVGFFPHQAILQLSGHHLGVP
jgi:hypothetical protein